MRRILDVFRSEKGASLVEYALIAALIAVVTIGALSLLGTNIQKKLLNVANAIGG